MPVRGRFALATPIAWAGAATFLLSLIWAAAAYLFDFDRRVVRLTASVAVMCNAGLFTVFALHHSVLARSRAKDVVRRLVPPELERSLYTWTASLLFIVVCAAWQPVGGTVYIIHGPWRLLAYAVQLTGLVLTVRSSAALDVLDLAGVRQVQRARAHMPPRHVALKTGGLYGFVRHPLYFAWLLMVWGCPDMTATRASFAAITTTYLALAIPWEERGLAETFGVDYQAYRTKVRWRMLPGVY